MSTAPKRRPLLHPNTVFWLLTLYKAVASVVVLVGAVLLLVHSASVLDGLSATAVRWASGGGAWRVMGRWLAEQLPKLPRSSVTWTGVLLLIDGTLLGMTAVALARRSPAARVLVLTAIGLPIVPEVYFLLRHPTPAELLVFIFNVSIFAYTWRHYPRGAH